MLSCFSYVRLFATLWTIVRQAPLSMGFPREEYEWVAMPSSRGSSPPGIEPNCLALQVNSLPTSHQELPMVKTAAAAAKLLRVSDSVWPQGRQPTRFPRPWDSPGKNTGVGCHFLLQCMKMKSEREVSQSCLTLRDPMDCSPPGSSVQGIFQTSIC